MIIYPYDTELATEIKNGIEISEQLHPLLEVEQDGKYLNIAASFDIETSRCYYVQTDSYLSNMYIWQVSIGGIIFYGRTWSDYIYFVKKLSIEFGLNNNRRIILYVHNLGFEFSFIKNIFNFTFHVFSETERSPYYAYDVENFIEYRCSLKLSGGYSLENVGKKLLTKYKIQKAVGELDYELYRHSNTPLTSNELDYCFRDVLVVTSYIQEKIEEDGGISQIPLTNTGYVRRFTSSYIFNNDTKYRTLMRKLTIDEKQYSMLKAAFQGGFVHCNAQYSGVLFDETNPVSSYDFKSSYPGEMVLNNRFPMEMVEFYEKIDSMEQFKNLLKKYCCLFEIRVENLQATELYETPLPASNGKVQCHSINTKLNNGKLVYTSEYYAVMTELDFEILELYYTYDSIQITNMYCYRPDRLPSAFVEAILYLYHKKTTLDGVAGKEAEYMVSKNMLNASFGMAVTDIVRYTLEFINGDWEKYLQPASNQLDSYNQKYYRFLSYSWGVWITAHCRMKLLTLIKEIGQDYIYADTDSIKLLNSADYEYLIKNYNLEIFKKQLQAASYHMLPIENFRPKNPKGKICSIGSFEYEGDYQSFKAIRAKTYCYVKNKLFNITISGLNKRKAVPYLISQIYKNIPIELLLKAYNGDKQAEATIISYNLDYIPVFNLVKDGLYIPSNYTGRLISSYKDTPYYIVAEDYMGKIGVSHELSGVSLIPSEYHLSLTADYLNFISGLRQSYGPFNV